MNAAKRLLLQIPLLACAAVLSAMPGDLYETRVRGPRKDLLNATSARPKVPGVKSLGGDVNTSEDSGLGTLPPVDAERLTSEGKKRIRKGGSGGGGAVTVFDAKPLNGASYEVKTGPLSGSLEIISDRGDALPGAGLEIILLDSSGSEKARTRTDSSGGWSLQGGAAGDEIHMRMDNDFMSLKNPDGSGYEWKIGPGRFTLDTDSLNGTMGFIYAQFKEGFDFAQAAGFPIPKVGVNYPVGSNSYSGGEINLTSGRQWDVNLHELGHALTMSSSMFPGSGGSHKIEDCYYGDRAGLAISEGLASFFSGAVRLNKGDAKAGFEHMAGGVALESVAANYCQDGDYNEIRVAAGFWDLFDENMRDNDGEERVTMAFSRIWGPLAGRTISDYGEAWSLLEPTLGEEEELPQVQEALKKNLLSVPHEKK